MVVCIYLSVVVVDDRAGERLVNVEVSYVFVCTPRAFFFLGCCMCTAVNCKYHSRGEGAFRTLIFLPFLAVSTAWLLGVVGLRTSF